MEFMRGEGGSDRMAQARMAVNERVWQRLGGNGTKVVREVGGAVGVSGDGWMEGGQSFCFVFSDN